MKEYQPTFFEEQYNSNLASYQPEQRIGIPATRTKEPEFSRQELKKPIPADVHPARVVVISTNLMMKI